MEELLLERMQKRKEQGQMTGIFQLDPQINKPRYFTPEQRIEEARRGTPVGEEFLFAEKKLMDELKRRM